MSKNEIRKSFKRRGRRTELEGRVIKSICGNHLTVIRIYMVSDLFSLFIL